MRVSHTLSVNRTTANGVHLRHDLQVTDDVAVRRNIAKDTAWVRIRVRSVRSSARWTFATSSIPEVGLRSVLIAGAIADHFFAFFTGANSSNPVNPQHTQRTQDIRQRSSICRKNTFNPCLIGLSHMYCTKETYIPLYFIINLSIVIYCSTTHAAASLFIVMLRTKQILKRWLQIYIPYRLLDAALYSTLDGSNNTCTQKALGWERSYVRVRYAFGRISPEFSSRRFVAVINGHLWQPEQQSISLYRSEFGTYTYLPD